MATAKFTFTWPAGEQKVIRDTISVVDRGLKDLRPVWNAFIPNLRRRHGTTFRRMADPFTGQAWPALDPKYAKRKRKLWGDKPILVASGTLKRAASQKGAFGQVIVMQPRFMEYGVDLGHIYPRVHQTTERRRKRDKVAWKRRWSGMEQPTDGIALQKQYGRVIALGQKAATSGRVVVNNVGRGTA